MKSETLQQRFPALAKEWSEKNLPLTPDQVTAYSHEVVWWKGKCGHEWQSAVQFRSKGHGCPYCSSRKVLPGFNDLATLYPDVAAQWSERNNPLTPDTVFPHSNRKYWWKCDKGHEWQATVTTRTGRENRKGTGCPYCSDRMLLPGFNDLATAHPQLAAEWSEKNLPLTPDKVMRNGGVNAKFWWKCPVCGNEYRRWVLGRLRGEGCPYCNRIEAAKGMNDLATLYPEIAAEWDDEKNGNFRPDMAAERCRKHIWWRCSAGHSWNSFIRERTEQGKQCPVCEAEFSHLFSQMLMIRTIQKNGGKVEIGAEAAGVTLEIYFPELGIAAEMEGLSAARKKDQADKKRKCAEAGIMYLAFPDCKDPVRSVESVREILKPFEIADEEAAAATADAMRSWFMEERKYIREGNIAGGNTNDPEGRNMNMTEEMKAFLKMLLAQEEETEAGMLKPEPSREQREQKKQLKENEENGPVTGTERDLAIARRDLYADHSGNITYDEGVPIWQKYALSIPEAAKYFHIGESKLRKIVAKDRYAKYLLWNGGRAYFKRKLFEEYLDSESEV